MKKKNPFDESEEIIGSGSEIIHTSTKNKKVIIPFWLARRKNESEYKEKFD